MFKYLKLLFELQAQKKINKNNEEIICCQKRLIQLLHDDISRRDQTIADQQKRMRFFGIQIGNEESEPEKLDFTSTIKL